MQFTANLEPFSHPQRAKLGASSLSMHQPLLRINKHVSRSQQQPQGDFQHVKASGQCWVACVIVIVHISLSRLT